MNLIVLLLWESKEGRERGPLGIWKNNIILDKNNLKERNNNATLIIASRNRHNTNGLIYIASTKLFL